MTANCCYVEVGKSAPSACDIRNWLINCSIKSSPEFEGKVTPPSIGVHGNGNSREWDCRGNPMGMGVDFRLWWEWNWEWESLHGNVNG